MNGFPNHRDFCFAFLLKKKKKKKTKQNKTKVNDNVSQRPGLTNVNHWTILQRLSMKIHKDEDKYVIGVFD